MTKVYTWSLATRLFHVLLILFILISYIVSDFDRLLDWHVAFGYGAGVLFLFRIVWGFMDVKYSRFKDFNFKTKDLIDYLTNLFTNKKSYISHNPASSWAIVAMIVLGLLSVISGALAYGTQEGMGVFSFLNKTLFRDMEFFKEIHEFIVNAFIFVIFAHIAGVLLDKIIHKTDTLQSMINGYKKGAETNLKLTLFQKIFAIFWIMTPILLIIYMLSNPSNILMKDSNKRVDYKSENTLFYEECSSCHIIYPPFLLPKKSWTKMMENLENHFGDDASLEEEDKNLIKNYLVKNSSETSTKESAYHITKSIKNSDIIAITKTDYWKKRHKKIDKEIFKSKEVSKISNCKACHKNFEQGLLNDRDISIPKERR